MRDYLRQLPAGVWLGLVIVGLGAWAQDLLGVVLGGILAVVTLIAVDRHEAEPPEGEDPVVDERFKDL